MSAGYEAELHRSARILSEISHTLESADDADERVLRALELMRDLLPYQRCSLLKAFPGASRVLFVVPELSAAERGPLLAALTRVFRLVAHAEEIGRSSAGPPHLTLPLMGLDEVIGLVRMEPSADTSYEVQHLRLFSVAAAQLGAYLAMIKLREEDARRTEELIAAHDFQRLLVGIVSHDLRNPLSVITTVASSLLRKTEDPQRAKALERALRSAERANRIINDLLDVTHIRVTGGLRVSRKRIDLLALLQEVLEDLRLAHPGRELQFVGPGEDAVPGEWDPDRLTQVVINLISNALQHGEEGAAVQVVLHALDEDVVLEVHNRGPVIPSDLRQVLFNPFKQGRHTQHRAAGGGLGLGLYIVDQIVRSHGGEVSVQSTAPEGTTLRVTLPRMLRGHRAPEHSSAASGSRGERSADERGRTESTTVMVVDDDVDVRSGIAELLQSSGYKVTAAANGAEALELLRRGPLPNLILVDLSMPVMDGESFCNACSDDAELASIPRFIISADAATAVKLTRHGAAGFLGKPLQANALLNAVEQWSESFE
ncbi:hybrid sensor histidine kinase/response regulator [Stigmatella hybrida]|uniref:hybrid sensor histidine kinase/response regulator n=1 Tax=Stigmatella hybrida TaxID=394097 RepID=UPI001CDB45AD|nr:hybrid sensor histidine kinase/response regulator [Stigmatella hybrida]